MLSHVYCQPLEDGRYVKIVETPKIYAGQRWILTEYFENGRPMYSQCVPVDFHSIHCSELDSYTSNMLYYRQRDRTIN